MRKSKNGYKGGKINARYGTRWMDETFFSRAKREYGEYVCAIKWENIVNGIRFQYVIELCYKAP